MRKLLPVLIGLGAVFAVVLGVQTIASVAEVEAGVYDPEWLEQARAEAEEELATALRDVDVEASGGVFAGTAVEELTEFSAHVDLLVVGSRAWGPVRRILIGSTAARLMREAHCPVLVVPRGVATGEPGEKDAGARADTPTVA